MKIGMEKCFLFLMGVLEERIQIMGGGVEILKEKIIKGIIIQ